MGNLVGILLVHAGEREISKALRRFWGEVYGVRWRGFLILRRDSCSREQEQLQDQEEGPIDHDAQM